MIKNQENKADKGFKTQITLYLPINIYNHFKEKYKELGYTTLAGCLRGVIRDRYISDKVVSST